MESSNTSKTGRYADPRASLDSLSSVSTTSLIFERISERTSETALLKQHGRNDDGDFDDEDPLKEDADDLENARFLAPGARVHLRGMDRRLLRIVTIGVSVVAIAWLGAL